MSEDIDKNKLTYPKRLCSIAEYFALFQESAVGEGATEIEVYGANATFVAGFQAALVAMNRIQELSTPEQMDEAWEGLWNQVSEFAENCQSEFERLAKKEQENK